MVVQATTPFYARGSFWSIARTIEAAGLRVEAKVERAPYADEYATNRGYVLARKGR